MYIKTLSLYNFRNYKEEEFEFGPGINYIYGLNAQGKTNILEALFVLFAGRSHRSIKESNLVRQGEQKSIIKADFSSLGRDFKAKMQIFNNYKKRLSINNIHITKLSRLSEYGRVVMFSPEDLTLIKGTPSIRRRFLDMSISQIKPVYITILGDYLKVLSQRNNLLKEIKKNPKAAETIDVWDQKLCELAGQITVMRKSFLSDILEYAKPLHKSLADEDLDIIYQPGCAPKEVESREKIELYFKKALKDKLSKDIELGQTTIGAHRDDFEVYIKNNNARFFSSQGQQRSVVLNLKLSLCEYINKEFLEYPVLLLDDITSELDIKRREFLLSAIGGKQIFITCTDKERVEDSKDIKYFNILGARIVKSNKGG